MRVQKSFEETPKLYLVPTPIGNYLDTTFRQIEVLKSVDVIFCEDTRVTKKFLNHFEIATPVKNYHIFNEDVRSEEIIDIIRSGKNVALVSDAGMPCISDPGYLVSRKCLDEDIEVVSLPGCNAALTALISSGIACNQFYFYGFLDHKKSQKIKELERLADFDCALLIYESPHRINETLECIYSVMGDRQICIARELTKHYEEYTRGRVSEIIEANKEFIGEIVVVIEKAEKKLIQLKLNDLDVVDHYNNYISQGLDSKEAMKKVAKDRGVSKSDIYKQLIGKI